MGKKGKTGVLKRLREIKKAEKAALKRDQVRQRREAKHDEAGDAEKVATTEDLAGYGFPVADEDEGEGEVE